LPSTLEKVACYKARSQITAFQILENDTLAFSTKLHGAKIFSVEECSALKNLSIELLRQKSTAVAFSQDSDLLAFANSNVIHIINTKNKLLLQTIRTNEGTIELLNFVPNTKYLLTGTKNGRVMQYRYDGRSHLSRLCSFGQGKPQTKERIKHNYVSAFAFFENIIAVTGFGGVITILKMHSYTNRYNIETSKVRINSLCFLNRHQLLSGASDGKLHIHSLKKYIPSKTIHTPFSSVHSLLLMANENFVLVAGDSRSIALFDIKNSKLVTSAYLTFHENVTKLLRTKENTLIVLLETQEIVKVVLPNANDIKTYILNNELDKAFKLIERDPMLKGTREHKRVEFLYELLYTQAIEELIKSNSKEARKLMKMFSDVESKKREINSIFKAFENYQRFQTLYLNKQYALAYALVQKHPALKRTQQYKKMEEGFKESFTFAQKQILIGRADLAKEILSTYITVLSKKPLIQLVLNQNSEFIEFLQAINDKEYAKVEKLLKKNEIFRQIPSYHTLQEKIEETLQKIELLIQKGEEQEAIELIKEYVNVPHIQTELQELYKDAKIIEKLKKSYEKSDFVSCYELLDSSHNLDNIKLAKMLEEHWSKLINQCEEFAMKGDIKNIKQTLGELMQISSRVDKIGDLLRLSFHTKIKALLAKKSFKSAESIIYSYLDIFGKDSEILLIMKSFEKITTKKLAITLQEEGSISRDNWKNSPLIMG